MYKQPAIKKHYKIFSPSEAISRSPKSRNLEQNCLFLLSEDGDIVISDPVQIAVLSRVNGDRDLQALYEALEGKITIEAIAAALEELDFDGILAEGNTNFGDADKSKSQRDRCVSIETIGLNPEITEMFANVLRENAIAVQSDAILRVAIVNDYLADELALINRQALDHKTPWLLVKPVGFCLWIGPLFEPHKTACWECLAQRLRGNRPVREYLKRHYRFDGISGNIDVSLPSSQYLAASLTADAIAKWLQWGQNPDVSNNILTLDARSLSIDRHPVIKRPQCPTCGNPQLQNIDGHPPLKLQKRRKTCFSDNGHRIATPEQVLERLAPYVSPISGVIRSFAKFDIGSDAPIHTYISRHEFRCLFDDLSLLRDNLRGRSAGKGTTDAQSKASAFCEAIERYGGVYQGNEPIRRASIGELGELAIAPDRCLLFSNYQYQHRERLNRDCVHYFQYIPEPFEPKRAIDWTPAWSLTERRSKWLPAAYCYHNYPVSEPIFCWADTNGTSAGNAIEEAIFQGMMELVERDAVAIWWYNCLKMPEVALNSFANPYIKNLKQYYDRLDRDLWVLDVTHDLGIPVFVALSRRRNAIAEDILFGAGAHLDPCVALLRSLSELNQSLPAVSYYDGDRTIYPPTQTDSDRAVLTWWTTATTTDQPYLLPDPDLPKKQARDYPKLWSDDLLEDIQFSRKQIEAVGLEVLILNQTQPDIDLSVVKVVVPGLRHFWRRLRSGRLYEVPVKLGWQQNSLTEEQLNPMSLFL